MRSNPSSVRPWSATRIAPSTEDGLPPLFLLARKGRDQRGEEVSRRDVALSEWALVLIERILSLLASNGAPVVMDGSEEVTTTQAAALLGVSGPARVAAMKAVCSAV